MSLDAKLRALPFGARIGMTGAVLSLLLGVWASLSHLREHHQNRDARPGVSIDDLRGAYHGIDNPAPLVAALEKGHPPGLSSADLELLRTWLASDKKSENYDNPDLGSAAPAEVIQRACLTCHARKATAGDGIGQRLPLEYWDDVEKVAFSRKLDATPEAILVTSTHTHALSLGVLTIVLGLLLAATRFPARLRSGLFALGGVGLVADLSGWWLARTNEAFIGLVVLGGAAWAMFCVATTLLVLAELWLPRRRV